MQATPINQNVASFSDFEIIFQNILQSILAFAGIVLFLMLLVGGYKYISAGGNPKNAEEAKLTLTYAIGGIVLVASAFLILRFIGVFTNVTIIEQFMVVR